MTSIALGPLESPTVESRTTTLLKKRRRRTAATGATDDCFACRKRSMKCDRNRPYCTPCIDIGKECSGYKTTLTWGVGVASRGKLRGLTCPVADKNIDGSNASPQEMEARRRKTSVSRVKRESISSINGMDSVPIIHGETSGPASVPPTYPMAPSMPIPIPAAHQEWHIPSGYQEHLHLRDAETNREPHMTHPQLQRLQTSIGQQYEGGFLEFRHTPDPGPFTDQSYPSYMINPYTDTSLSVSSADSLSLNSASVDSYADAMSSSVDSEHSTSGFQDNATIGSSQAELSSLNTMLYGNNDMLFGPLRDDSLMLNDLLSQHEQEEMDMDRKEMGLIDARGRFNNTFFHLPPRVQSLLDYYDRNICPVLVAFDSPSNPYRMHVLQLAVHNEGLQNAIAALATNNIRMRRKQLKSFGFVEEITEAFDSSQIRDDSEPSPEETCYKSTSIDQLNMQLIDPQSAQDDGVLATLLILCLFHVCDSGFSKFKTQLAGVQKLLSMRNPNVQNNFIGWVEMFFTWFDVMTSTVNDRETQIRGYSLDMLDFSANLGALEQFSGCDGRLFKLIARLGRLNMLAQNRPVRPLDGSERTPKSTPRQWPTKHPSTQNRATVKHSLSKTLSAVDYDDLDGDGSGTPIISSDEEMEAAKPAFKRPAFDKRYEFWSEWHDIRYRLESWQMDTTSIPSPSPNPFGNEQLGPEQRDLSHISESFRYSALLYTERLANPLLPSSSPNFQNLVSQALYHITELSVTSCVNKFLLWPLFITGTECVDEGHRQVVRTRCIEIQKESGFFNNQSALEVLERVWKDAGSNMEGGEAAEVMSRRRDGEAGNHGRYGQPLRFRKSMGRVDGEYILM